MSDLRCDVCAVGDERTRIVKFALVRAVSGARTSRGAGAIHLCQRCWKGTAATRMRGVRIAA